MTMFLLLCILKWVDIQDEQQASSQETKRNAQSQLVESQQPGNKVQQKFSYIKNSSDLRIFLVKLRKTTVFWRLVILRLQ